MPNNPVITLLHQQREDAIATVRRIDAALHALEGGVPAKKRGRPRKAVDDPTMPDWARPAAKKVAKRKGRKYTAAQRKAASERMAARWAAKKKAPAKRKAAKK